METFLGRTLFVQMEGAVLTSLCCGLDELIQRTRASQHCTDFYLRGGRRLNYELKFYMAVAAASSWVSEGVLNNNVDDDRLLRKYTDHGKSLLQDVCFAEHVSQFKWARLAALVGGETTAGMLSSDAVRAAHVCSGFMVMGISMGAVLWRYPFQLDLHGSSRG